jgi:hypothetical protein
MCDAQWRQYPASQVWAFVTLLLACVNNIKVWNSSSFKPHYTNTKFRENPSSGVVSVYTELQWIGWGLLRLRLVKLDCIRWSYMRSRWCAMASTSHLTCLSVRKAEGMNCDRISLASVWRMVNMSRCELGEHVKQSNFGCVFHYSVKYWLKWLLLSEPRRGIGKHGCRIRCGDWEQYFWCQ